MKYRLVILCLIFSIISCCFFIGCDEEATTTNGSTQVIVNNNINSVNHRGYCSIAPENTLSAYRLSKEKGFTAVECDVSFTKDGVPVLLHDATIDRTCASGQTGNIADLTYAEVSTYDFSYDKPAYAGEKIPTLDEFLALCRNIGLHPYIELKSYETTAEQAKQVVDKVIRNGMKGKVSYISFSSTLLASVVEKDPTARVGYLVNGFGSAQIAVVESLKTANNQVFLDCNYGYMTTTTNLDDNLESTILRCIEYDVALEVWTINDKEAIKNMDPYISGVTSDTVVAGNVLYDASK